MSNVSLQATAKRAEVLMFILLHIILVLDVRGDPICPWGKYGDTCDKNCSEHCRILPSLGIIHCDRTSGSCSEGCIPGWYDDTCNKKCNTKCINNICNHGDGACTTGCKDGETGNFCEISGEEHETKGNDSTTPLWKILVPFIVIIVLLLVFMFQIGRMAQRRNMTRLLKRKIPDTPLHKASAEGNLDLANEIMDDGLLNANTRGLYGLTPLMLAAKNGRYDVFEHLQRKGGDMTLKDSDGDHILSMACEGGNMDIVKYVVSREPNLINRTRTDGRTALMWAAWHGKTTVFEYLLARKATLSLADNDGDTILHYACYGGHTDIVKYIIDDTTIDINTRNVHGRTALMEAATYGHKDVFYLLVGKDSGISHKDDKDNNILHAACRGGHIDIVKYVIDNTTIDINTRNVRGRTALMEAATYGHKDVFDLLVGKDSDTSHKDDEDNNILHAACRGGHIDIVKYVIDNTTNDINTRDLHGRTALMVAATCGHKDVFDLLVGKDSDTSHKDDEDNNILHAACR
ncbi:putative ankyrin repeat protein RF_0381 [Haliotis cracherodii]|uniref:putative ankyrin repeat protein RF_0381 n=1 Tax=Haliotis cracherodii TaxID=6455 RepID=UPI0039EB3786